MQRLLRWLAQPENTWATLIAIVAGYLFLYNLGYAPLWYDETAQAIGARNLLATGGYSGWDGRNLLTAFDGASVNADLQMYSYPIWQVLPSLLGFVVFGDNEVGVRFFHALLGYCSLFLFWRLLRLDFPDRPRLRVLAFAMFALSAQVILDMRLGRYRADAIFFTLLLLYAHRLYMGTRGNTWHLALMVAATVLGFLNQYFIALVNALALIAVHLAFHRRQTSRQQWLQLAGAGAVSAAACLAYLLGTGILQDHEQLEFARAANQHGYIGRDILDRQGWLARSMLVTWFNFRDLVWFAWLPLWPALWVAALLAGATLRRLLPATGDDGRLALLWRSPWVERLLDGHLALLRHLLFIALVLALSAFINSIPFKGANESANSRYLVAALPSCALLLAAFVDWAWRHRTGPWLAIPLLATLLLTNLANLPLTTRHLRFGNQATFTLPLLVREIHAPYPSAHQEMAQYLRVAAEQDDTIFVYPWTDHDIMLYYIGGQLLLCCVLSEDTTSIPRAKVLAMDERLYDGSIEPEWIAIFTGGVPPDNYALVFISRTHRYPYQQPDLELHSFVPTAGGRLGARLYRKKKRPKE